MNSATRRAHTHDAHAFYQLPVDYGCLARGPARRMPTLRSYVSFACAWPGPKKKCSKTQTLARAAVDICIRTFGLILCCLSAQGISSVLFAVTSLLLVLDKLLR